MARIRLEDGTVWPLPEDTEWRLRHGEMTGALRGKAAAIVSAYNDLISHPWGTEGSIKKIRMLRRAIRNAEKE